MILDTNALSALADGDALMSAQLEAVAMPSLPAIVLGEFRYGVLGSRLQRRYERWLDSSLPAFSILPVDAETAGHYARLRHGLKARGTPIPENDVWIAALSQQHQLPVLSRDRHFSLIPGVRLIGW